MKKVFFIFSVKNPELNKERLLIYKGLKDLGYTVAENSAIQYLINRKTFDSHREMNELNNSEMASSDYFVAEMSVRSFTTGFFYSQAVTQKKPSLFLQKTKNQEEFAFTVDDGVDQNLTIAEYADEKGIKNALKKFLSNATAKGLVKFNFIITPAISDYLDWVAFTRKKAKSDYLREKVVSDIIEKDEEYFEYMKSKKNPFLFPKELLKKKKSP